MELSQDELELVANWQTWAEDEGAPSAHTPEGKALAARIQEAIKPEPKVSVELTVSELDLIDFWYRTSDDLNDDEATSREWDFANRLRAERQRAV